MSRHIGFGNKKTQGAKQWVHPAEALLRGHIVYNVKFLGHVEVDQPKGTEVVKEAIRKMKFNKQIKKAEGQKPPKVELTISVDGVTIQEPKYKVIQHQYPLHRISYCADDKSDKRMFTFIAKETEGVRHHCFVFDSEKCAEEITLTIGQAFDLAYKKFLETSGKDMDAKKQFLMMQKKVQQLTQENLSLKERVADLERMVDFNALNEYNKKNQKSQKSNAEKTPSEIPVYGTVLPKASRQNSVQSPEVPVVGRKLENLLLEDDTAQPNGTTNKQIPALAPPPPVGNRSRAPANQQTIDQGTDLFGASPFNVASPQHPPANQQFGKKGEPKPADPFGMAEFNPDATQQELDMQIQNMDREFLDLQAGFSAGLSFGSEDFSLEDLDPLGKK